MNRAYCGMPAGAEAFRTAEKVLIDMEEKGEISWFFVMLLGRLPRPKLLRIHLSEVVLLNVDRISFAEQIPWDWQFWRDLYLRSTTRFSDYTNDHIIFRIIQNLNMLGFYCHYFFFLSLFVSFFLSLFVSFFLSLFVRRLLRPWYPEVLRKIEW